MKTIGLILVLLLPSCASVPDHAFTTNRPATHDCLTNPPTEGFRASICRDLLTLAADEHAARMARVIERRAIFTPSPWNIQEPRSFDTRIYTNLGNGFIMGPDSLYVFY